MKTQRIPTTYEVYRAILNAHVRNKPYPQELGVFESCTDIVEDGFCRIYTVWGLRGGDVPLVGAETTYCSSYDSHEREDEKHSYWLYAVMEEEEY